MLKMVFKTAQNENKVFNIYTKAVTLYPNKLSQYIRLEYKTTC